MKNYKNSDYALNKFSDGIVYRFSDRTISVYTLKDFLADNPDKTEADFFALKERSDNDYLEQDKEDYRITWKDVSLDAIADALLCPVPSAENFVVDGKEEKAQNENRSALAKEALGLLTETQRRRYILHHAKGKSTREIATMEDVSQRTVMDSLEAAQKKIKIFLKNGKK